MSVGEPGVERPHRHFHREAQEHRPEHQPGEGPLEDEAPSDQFRDVEGGVKPPGTRLEIQRQEAQQHEGRAEQGENEELDGRIEPGLHFFFEPGDLPHGAVPPDSDHEIHGQQHQFEEDEEQHQIQGQESPVHSGGEDQNQTEKGPGIAGFVPVLPGVDDAKHHDQGGEHQQRKADPVQSDVIVGADRPDPGQIHFKLELSSRSVVEPDGHYHRQ